MSMSAKVKAALQSVQAGGALLTLFTISHPNISTLYYTDNPMDITYGGQVYVAMPGELDWPGEMAGSISSAAITMYRSNELLAALRGTSGFVNVGVKVIWYDAAAEATELVKSDDFIITEYEYSDSIIQATLSVDDVLNYEILPLELTAQMAPGLFV